MNQLLIEFDPERVGPILSMQGEQFQETKSNQD